MFIRNIFASVFMRSGLLSYAITMWFGSRLMLVLQNGLRNTPYCSIFRKIFYGVSLEFFKYLIEFSS